jgi:hypothetical protein
VTYVVRPLRIVDDVLGELELTTSTGYNVQKVDLGFPAVRDDVDDRVQANGTDDRTAYHGARAVSLDVTLVPELGQDSTPHTLLDALTAYCRPGLRPYLYVPIDDGTERRIRLRADQRSAPFVRPGSLEVQVAWRAPDGVLEGDLVEHTLPATADVEAGAGFDWEFDLAFPAMSPAGAGIVTNEGNTSADAVFRLYGPCENPRLENQTIDERIVFDGLTVAAGSYVEIDVRTGAVTLNGVPEASRFGLVDFSVSTFFHLEPGENLLRYYPETFSGAALAVVLFRPTWL